MGRRGHPGVQVAAGLEPRGVRGGLRVLETAESSLPAVTPHLRNVRGYALMNAGRLEEALVEYLAVVEVRPGFRNCVGVCGALRVQLGQPDRGVAVREEGPGPG